MKANYKNALLITITLFAVWLNDIQAQQYQPLPVINAEWNIVWYKDPEGWIGNNPYLYHYKYRIEKDTIIDNKTYQVYIKINYNTICAFDSTVETAVLFLRNDINNKKVYVLEGNEENELYNFNLNVDDTLKGFIFSNHPDIYYTVGSIDSVVVIDNYHKRYNLYREGYFKHDYLIEGVGYSWGLNEYAPTGFWPFYELRCFQNNNQLGYINSFTGNCSLETDTCIVSAHEYQPTREIEVYPNPATDYVRIKFNNSKWVNLPKLVRLYNASGTLLFKKNYTQSEEEIIINIDEFGFGIVLIQIISKDDVRFWKIIRQ